MNNDEILRNITDWQCAILQLLYKRRRSKPASGGAFRRELSKELSIADATELEQAINFLLNEHLIGVDQQKFMITADGVDIYHKIFPNEDSGSPDFDKYGPSFWGPSGQAPDDPSHVPRGRRPSDRSGGIALPLPDTATSELAD